jgi:hypothetical protein
MRRFLLLAAFLAAPAYAQQAQQRPFPEEVAFARLAPELQAMLAHLPPAEALRQVEFARQNLIATGNPNPTREQLRRTLQAVLSSNYYVESASAGETPLPPLSPLVAPPPPRFAR